MIFADSKVACKYEDVCKEYILLLTLRMYLLISFTQPFTTFANGLVFTLLQVRGEPFIYLVYNVCSVCGVCVQVRVCGG